ncbi:hypothetical protein BFW90_23600 [Pseudomonas fluorescens]|jgi:hypothetical protein|nr:hypothetical protein BFW90_23600 [Pseudomonas fluorescens]
MAQSLGWLILDYRQAAFIQKVCVIVNDHRRQASSHRQIVYHFDIYLEQSNSFLRTSGSPL